MSGTRLRAEGEVVAARCRTVGLRCREGRPTTESAAKRALPTERPGHLLVGSSEAGHEVHAHQLASHRPGHRRVLEESGDDKEEEQHGQHPLRGGVCSG